MLLPADVYLKIINLRHRTDRRLECLAELQRAGIPIDEGAFFDARHTPGFGALGCALSHGKALSDFLFEDSRAVALILEDDFSLRDAARFGQDLQACLDSGERWEACLLGHNLAVPIEATGLPQFMRVVHAQTTSGYLVRRSFAPELIASFYRSAELLRKYEGLPEPNRSYFKSVASCDILWKELQLRHRFWAAFPSMIFQRESFSDIEGRTVAYQV